LTSEKEINLEKIYNKYRLNHNQRKEAEEIIQELMLKDTNLTISYFENFEADTNQISSAFITYLREIRYPQYSLYHKELSALLDAIHNNNQLFRVIYNDNFESDEYQISPLSPSHSSTDIDKKLEEKKEYLNKLSNLIKGNLPL